MPASSPIQSVSQQETNVVGLFLQQARRAPERIALIDRDGSQISYGELEKAVRQTAAHFEAKGIRAGDRVLIFVPMSLDLYRIVLALFFMGATAVFLDEWVNARRLALCCELANCKAMVGSRKALWLTYVLRPLRRLSLRLDTRYSTDLPESEMREVDPEDTALITFTTGSTGIPKAADRSHAFLQAQFDALRTEIQPQPGDVAMPVLPIVLLINLGAGACSVIADFPARKPARMQAGKILAQMQAHGVNRLTASPYFVERLAQYVEEHHLSAPDVDQIFTGGAPVFPSLAAQMIKSFPKAACKIAYGSTEAEPISMAQAQEVITQDRPQSGLYVGQPYSGGEVAVIPIVDTIIDPMSPEEWAQTLLSPSQIGEIVVKGPHVLKRYIDNPEAWKRNKIQVGEAIWHRTGDAGFLTEEEALYLTGRCSQMIARPGGYVAPFLIEGLVHTWPGVTMGTIQEVEDQLWLILETRQSAHQLVEAIDKLYPKPDRVLTLKRIPRDPRHHSKIDYPALRQRITPKK